jgi:hypothetical protein
MLAALTAQAEDQRTLGVLQTTTTAAAASASEIQSQLADKFNKTRLFQVQTQTGSLTGYDKDSIEKAFDRTGTDLLAFAYVDNERVALFLFDADRPGKYIATSDPLKGSPTNRLTAEWIDLRMSAAFTELMRQYAQATFEDIPAPPASEPVQQELTKEERGRRLFSELSTLQDGTFYLGASLGMARFSAQGASASVVSIGGYGGIKVIPRVRLEAGADIFSYLLLHADVKIQLPIAEKYLIVALGGGANQIAAVITQNRGFNPTYLQTGQFLFGPSLSFDVPLMGASIRGDIRLLLGSASVLLATYGLAYTL